MNILKFENFGRGKSLYEKLIHKAKIAGFLMKGNETTGYLEFNGFILKYVIMKGELTIEIIKKPVLVPLFLVKKEICAFVNSNT